MSSSLSAEKPCGRRIMKFIMSASVFCFMNTTFMPLDNITSLMLSLSTFWLTIVPEMVGMSRLSTLIRSSFFASSTSTSDNSSSVICFTRCHMVSTSSFLGNIALSVIITPISILRPLVMRQNSSRNSSAVILFLIWRSAS